MLGLFSAKPDHPLADAKEAKRVLAELPAGDPATSIDSASAWVESLLATTEFKAERRLDLILQIDEAVLPQIRRLAREYLTAPRLTRSQEFKLWQLNRGYWAEMVKAYADCLARFQAGEKGADGIKGTLGLLLARLLHAYGAQLKWDQFRYGPVDGNFWLAAGTAYLAAAQARIGQREVMLYANTPSSPDAEYMKMLVFQASSMDKLLPVEIELAERLIAYFLPGFLLTDEVRPDNVYWVDAAKALPPTRLARLPEVTPTLRFFNTVGALDAVAKLRGRIEQSGALPADINFGGQYSVRVVLPVLDHLALCWAPKPPLRSHARHQVKSRLAVVGGLAPLHRRLAGLNEGNSEAWVVEDVSLGGMGAQVPLRSNDWLRIGAVMAMQPDGGSNWLVGIIRRFTRETDSLGSVGIETLSKVPRAVTADFGGLRTDMVLLDPVLAGEPVRALLAVSAWEDKIPATFSLDGADVRLLPQQLIESGSEMAVGRYVAQVS